MKKYLFSFTLALTAAQLTPTQAQSSLDGQLFMGLTITGSVGTVYQIQYVTDLTQTSNPTAWRCSEFLQLQANPYVWIDRSAPSLGQRFYRALEFGAPTNMVYIPPGTFNMGSPSNEVDRFAWEGPQTAVTISRGFWMAKNLITQGEYLALIGSNPSYFSTNRGFPQLFSLPVETVSWFDATNYCSVLTQKERIAGRIPANCVYRLPTEAEFEYACRAWTSTRFSYGDDPGYLSLTNYAWYRDNTSSTQPVGSKLPNPWGLYDMHGNLLEWCQDWWAASLPGGIVLDPGGPPTGEYRVFRGNGWPGWAGTCRSASRYWSSPGVRNYEIGFRIVMTLDQ